jgi:hypothetical protein
VVPLADCASIARSFLFKRLKWPVPMVRWRAAKEIRDLLNDPITRPAVTDMLLDYLEGCKTESEVSGILSIVFLTTPAGRPTRTALISRIRCPSLLSDIIIERTYGTGPGIGWWWGAHSGAAPRDFEGRSYFEKYKTAHVPPVLADYLEHLERESGLPFHQQWAFEWRCLRDKLATRCTAYPHYFDNFADVRAGITGQYWQRMREVYRSAYLRTLAFAVSEWRLPQKIAEGYCFELTEGIAGLFEVQPGQRPVGLSDIPERFCRQESDFSALVGELVKASTEASMRLVSLNTPIASSVKKYAKLRVTTHLLTPDYQLPPGGVLFEKMPLVMIDDTFELKGPRARLSVEEARTAGVRGDEAAVCNGVFPMPFGSWQGDYLSLGFAIPASYVIEGTHIACASEGIDLKTEGAVVATTRLWNDAWTPSHPKGGTTRCGMATMMDSATLNEAQVRLGRKLAFFVRLQIWDREKEYGDFAASERSALVTVEE